MFEILSECEDFTLLQSNISTEKLSLIEEILSGGNEAHTGNELYELVIEWCVGNIDTENFIQGILNADDDGSNLLCKFESVKIQNKNRLNGEDASFCLNHQALYEKVLEHYKDMYVRLQALKAFDKSFQKSIEEDNTYTCDGYSRSFHTKQFIEIDEPDLIKLIMKVHNIFIRQINKYFRDKYDITIEDKEAVDYLSLQEPPEPEWHYKQQESPAVLAYKQAHRQYIQDLIGSELHYDMMVDDIFLLLGGRSFEEQLDDEIKTDVRAAVFCNGKPKHTMKNGKITFDILSSTKDYYSKRYEVSLNGSDYQALLRALSYFDSGKKNTSIYTQWLQQFVDLKKDERSGIYDGHETGGKIISNFKYYKNGKFEVTFINHKTALRFAREFLNYEEGSNAEVYCG